MTEEVRRVVDVELIRAAQVVTPVVLGLVAAFVLRGYEWGRRLILAGLLVYVLYVGEQVVGQEFLGGLVGGVKRVFEPKIEGVPTLEKHVADRYIISRLGRENFNLLVSFDPQLSVRVDGSPHGYGYRMVYHFEPLLEYQESDVFEVAVRNGQVESAHVLPNCLKDASLCQFEVTREEAIEIARLQGLRADDLQVGTTSLVENGLAIVVSSCQRGERLLIDYRDGEVIGRSKWECEMD